MVCIHSSGCILNGASLIPGSRLIRCSSKAGRQEAKAAVHSGGAHSTYLKLDKTGEKERLGSHVGHYSLLPSNTKLITTMLFHHRKT